MPFDSYQKLPSWPGHAFRQGCLMDIYARSEGKGSLLIALSPVSTEVLQGESQSGTLSS